MGEEVRVQPGRHHAGRVGQADFRARARALHVVGVADVQVEVPGVGLEAVWERGDARK